MIGKLGKQAVRHDERTLMMAKYLTAELPTPPASIDWTKGLTAWGSMLNNNLGCCTIAAVGHAVQSWRLNSDSETAIEIIPDATILEYYEQWDGYNPSDPNTDQGGVELSVLTEWRKGGFAAHNLDAYVSVNRSSQADIMAAIWMFGGMYIGVELPISAQTQDVWDVTPGHDSQPGSWGGHAIFIVGYDASGLTCITWGAPKKMTWAWFAKYCSEAYALVSAEWIMKDGKAPSGFDMTTLLNDLELVTQN